MGENYWLRRKTYLSRRTFLRGSAAGAVGAGALAVVGCGDDDDETPTPTATRTATGTTPGAATRTPTAAAGTPKDGSYYSAHLVGAGTTLDMHRELYRGVILQMSLAYNNLIAWDNLDAGTMTAEIAEKLPEQPDQTKYVFTIRKGIKWQNKPPANGRELTMDDIRFNIERQMTKKLSNGEEAANFYRHGPIYSHIDKVEYTDDTHFTVTLKKPRAPWLSTFCDEFNVIQSPEVLKQIEGDFATFDPKYVLGTGPYIVDRVAIQTGSHMTRNPDYFLKKLGAEVQYFDEIFFSNLGTDVNAVRAAFEQKQIDVFTTPQRNVIDAVASAQPAATKLQIANPNLNLEFAYAYTNSPAFSNPNIRKAVYIATDRKLVAEQHFQGLARPNPPIPWAFTDWAIPQTELATYPGYRQNKEEDIKEARALWAAGGGEALSADLFQMVIVDTADQSLKEWFPAMLNRNLNTNKFSVTSIPVSSLLQYNTSQNSVGYLGGWDQWTSPDPRQRFADVHSATGNINFWKYSTPEMEALIAKAFETFDRAEAIKIMKDAQKVALNDAGAGHIHMAGAITQILQWPYVKRVGPYFITYERNLGKRSWIDQTDPTFQGRRKPA
jgi:peptide/nickel transport system substrate-binding protein